MKRVQDLWIQDLGVLLARLQYVPLLMDDHFSSRFPLNLHPLHIENRNNCRQYWFVEISNSVYSYFITGLLFFATMEVKPRGSVESSAKWYS